MYIFIAPPIDKLPSNKMPPSTLCLRGHEQNARFKVIRVCILKSYLNNVT